VDGKFGGLIWGTSPTFPGGIEETQKLSEYPGIWPICTMDQQNSKKQYLVTISTLFLVETFLKYLLDIKSPNAIISEILRDRVSHVSLLILPV
jgi:hypothetical protein